jgi:hypothetical protein
LKEEKMLKTVSLSLILTLLLICLAIAEVGVSNLTPDKYQVGTIAVGEKYYIDRDYTVISLPVELEGATLIMTGNDDKASTGAGYITFDIDRPTTVYIGHDSRGEEAKGGTPPEWLLNDFILVEGWEIEVTDSNMGTFNVWKKDFPAGTVELSGNADPPAAGQGSMYTILLVPAAGGTSVKTEGKLSATWAAIKSKY